ncbi:tryptophan dimethylallyltransferase fgaPT2 [Aspergillus homomorphus CBS 101889]|uniref:Tryptophan dimethylallyltransferase FgaPT2 n=1 Tax=Aspergillus homomorphus (strain CBS 101889) TaxID=1450537 RepID=A0A395IAL6_ASPHC|nr:tryptophan dimethylallyltransferase FgaPT2 [Aspergillus homomorphus CBS 101889]RAL15194.1 tryptophan dimethylallyltransferase FgaPT2 [Aspergillus homomorphus CBS 101889]
MAANASYQQAYQVLSEIFDFPNDEQRSWWHSTAPMFAQLLQTADYEIHTQYRCLAMFKKHVIPFLGVYPTNDRDRWLSILTRYGTPFELSLNCSDSLVRYTYEPITAASGTTTDPFNTFAIWEALKPLMAIEPSLNLEWFTHFKRDLTLDAAESAWLQQHRELVDGQIQTQNKLALDLKGGRVVPKTYIYPALKETATGRSVQELMFSSMRSLAHRYPAISAPLDMLEAYVHSRGPHSTATPRLLSCDLIDPAKSRIKVYLLERMVSLDAMRELWTLGGRRDDAATHDGWAMIEELWELLDIPPGLRSYPEPFLPLGSIPPPGELLPSMANFTLHQNDPMPEPQVYFTVFGMNDMAIARALTTFFARHGWTRMAQRYEESLRASYPHALHEELNYIHAYISFSYRKGRPYLSVYLQTLETGDWAITRLEPDCTETKEAIPVSVNVGSSL